MEIQVNGRIFEVLKLLGKGKGGYSYLVSDGKGCFVVKQIHHEPCAYYQFGNKMESELRDYARLRRVRIPMPELIDADRENERIRKEYIEGETAFNLVLCDEMREEYLGQVQEMSRALRAANINIDYFPTNFVLQNGLLYYVDYECNDYMDEWSFENWGVKYWSKTPEFLEYAERQGF